MFRLFRTNPLKKLEAEHHHLLENARDLQRNGDIKGFALMMQRADEAEKKIAALKRETSQ